jgi:hypothetical protein
MRAVRAMQVCGEMWRGKRTRGSDLDWMRLVESQEVVLSCGRPGEYGGGLGGPWEKCWWAWGLYCGISRSKDEAFEGPSGYIVGSVGPMR